MKKIKSNTSIAIMLLQFAFATTLFAGDNPDSNSEQILKSSFFSAKEELNNMLIGKIPLSYEQAIFTMENAYWGNSVDYSYFNSSLQYHVGKIKNIIAANRNYSSQKFKQTFLETIEQQKEKYDKALANWAIFKYITDTTFYNDNNNIYYNFPFQYVTNDPLGSLNWANTQVFNLLDTRSKTGNCFALASLFKIFSDRLNSDAIICTAPGHIYIRHADHKGIFHNVELATRSFPGTGTMETLTYTTDDATKNRISLRELDLKQSVALCLVYLAKGYEHTFNIKDDDFIFQCSDLALQYDSLNLNAMLLKAEVLEERTVNKNKSVALLQNDKEFQQYEKLISHLYKLGYREMPLEMKNYVIAKLRKDSTAMIFTDHTPQPFAHLGVKDDRYATLSGGLFDEMHETKPFEQYQRTIFDTKKNKISKFVALDTTYNNYPIDLVVFAWSIDPMAHKLPGMSPYSAMANNPILMFDADGNYPFTVHIRSYHPNKVFGSFGKPNNGFHGDDRGFSLSTANDVKSRVNHQFTFDVAKGTIAYDSKKDTWANESSDVHGNKGTGTPEGEVSAMIKTDNVGVFSTSYEGNNPLKTSPYIDVAANFNVMEDTKNGLLNISMNASGDDFPNTEAFLTDASGQSLFLGVDVREPGNDDSPYILFGGATTPIMNTTFSVSLDKKGNFTGVNSGGKNYSITDWNKKFTDTPAKPTDKKK